MKKKSNTVKILNKILFLFILCFFAGCSHKVSSVVKAPYQGIYQGTIWWEIYIFNNNQTKIFSGYADFQAGEDFLYLKIKSPFGTLGYGKWLISSFNLIEIYDLYHKKHFLIEIAGRPELRELPFYFLGLKEEKTKLELAETFFYYFFDKERKEGVIDSNLLKFRWKIKTLTFSEYREPILKDTNLFENFQKIKISF